MRAQEKIDGHGSIAGSLLSFFLLIIFIGSSVALWNHYSRPSVETYEDCVKKVFSESKYQKSRPPFSCWTSEEEKSYYPSCLVINPTSSYDEMKFSPSYINEKCAHLKRERTR